MVIAGTDAELGVVTEVVKLVWLSFVCGVSSGDDANRPHDTRTSIAATKADTIFRFTFYHSLNIRISIFTGNLIVNTDCF